jgi:hypothetical protein
MCALLLFFVVVGHSSNRKGEQSQEQRSQDPRQAYQLRRGLYVRRPEKKSLHCHVIGYWNRVVSMLHGKRSSGNAQRNLTAVF